MMRAKLINDGNQILTSEGLCDTGWKIVIDEHPTVRGVACRIKKREIGVSAWLVENNSWAQIFNILVHEIAHALCPGHNHDKVWKQTCLRLGGTGKRCWNKSDGLKGSTRGPKQKPKYTATCPACEMTHKAHRLRKDATYYYKCNRVPLSWENNNS